MQSVRPHPGLKLARTERRLLAWLCRRCSCCAAPLAHNGATQWGENMPNMSLYRSKLLRQPSDPGGSREGRTNPPPSQPTKIRFTRGDQFVVKPPSKAQLMSAGRPVMSR